MIRIDEELHSLIPPLTVEEFQQLEANIIDEGIREPLVLWQGVIIDGHNRFTIAKKHGFEYQTVEKNFDNKSQVIEWMILNQFGRRNLSNYQRSILALRLKPVFEEKAKEKQRESGGTVPQKSAKPPIETRNEIAKIAGVSHDTIAKVQKIEAQATTEVKEQLSAGTMSINEAYKETVTPHVAKNSGNNEWYTPEEFIIAARSVMGVIDLDPASSDIANQTVEATKYFTVDDDGLSHAWQGNVWMNPPYAGELIGLFVDKLVLSVEMGDVSQAIVLVNNATETAWFYKLVRISSAIVFPTSRIKFNSPNGQIGAPLQGQAILYVGERSDIFFDGFACFGWGVIIP